MFNKIPFGQLIRYSAICLLMNIMHVELFAQTSVLKSNDNTKSSSEPEFKNQGEQEDYSAKEVFQNQYKKKIFERFKGTVTVNGNNYMYGSHVLILAIPEQLKSIFKKGIFYPGVFGDHYADNQPINVRQIDAETESTKTDSEKEATRKMFFYMTRTDSLIITNFNELKFMEKDAQHKRFEFWMFRKGVANPTVYYLELTNEKATKKKDVETFIDGATLTFFKEGGIII